MRIRAAFHGHDRHSLGLFALLRGGKYTDRLGRAYPIEFSSKVIFGRLDCLTWLLVIGIFVILQDEYHPDIALLSRTPRDQSVELDQICSRITSGATKELESPQVVPFPEEKCYGTVATELGIELASETEQFHDVSYGDPFPFF